MKNKVKKIKTQAKQLALLISQIDSADSMEKAYNSSLDLLFNIHELESVTCAHPTSRNNTDSIVSNRKRNQDEHDEVEKVKRKLPLWAKRKHQINSKILTLFLRLENEGNEEITESMLAERYGNLLEFQRNFPQMKIISSKNHGKIFDVNSGIIKIWPPILPFVKEHKDLFLNNI